MYRKPPFSKYISDGVEAFPEVVGPIWDKINKQYGTNYTLDDI